MNEKSEKPAYATTFFNALQIARQLNEEWLVLGRKLTKLMELMLNPPKVEVGTTPHETVYEEDKLKLYHYIPVRETVSPPLLLVYALVNKPYIMDLQPDRSIINALVRAGIDIYLIDWGIPSDGDKFLTLDDYINRYMNHVVDYLRETHGTSRIAMHGYCMGGTFATMYAALYPEKIDKLIVMAAPIHFDIDTGLLHIWGRKEYFNVDKVVDVLGNAPGEFLNGGFLLLDPVRNMLTKYLGLLDEIEHEETVLNFMRMEKWIFDGVPVAGETFREFIKKGYQENLLIKNAWEINGKRVVLSNIKAPLLILVADKDHLVPPESTLPLYDAVGSKDKTIIRYPTGHIGLSVSHRAHRDVWPKVAEWLRKRSAR